MAQRVVITDDLDGTEGARPVRFSLEGEAWVVDLAEANVERLREVLAPFVSVARRDVDAAFGGATSVRRRSVTEDRAANADSREERALIRAWAEERGIEIAARGPVAASVVEQYRAWAAAQG